MDGIGDLELSWSCGYDGSQLQFISKDVMCYKSGIHVKFVKGSEEETVYSSPGEGLAAVAVHGVNKVFAIADQSVPPKIFVVNYPTFTQKSLLEGGAQLEYIRLAFSASEYLASISGVPDYQLTIWRYTDGTKLCTAEVSHMIPTSMSFNAANWRQLCITGEKELTVWTVEQSGETFVIQDQKLRLPPVDGAMDDYLPERDLPTRASTRCTVDVPRTSIARVKGNEADTFMAYEDKRERATPLAHCWMPTGDILVGCAGGQLLKVDGEAFDIKILYNPGYYAYASFSKDSITLDGKPSREPSQMEAVISGVYRDFRQFESDTDVFVKLSQEENIVEEIENPSWVPVQNGVHPIAPTPTTPSHLMGEGSIAAVALHKSGLYLGGDDGIMRHVQINNNEKLQLKNSYSLGYSITALAFNPPHHRLAAGGANGTLQLLDVDTPDSEMQTLREDHLGNFTSIAMLSGGTDNENCVTLRDDGEIQVWSMETGRLKGCMPLGLQGICMASSPMIHGVVVGTSSGFMYFVDCNKLDQMRIVHRLKIHQGPIKQLKFTPNGKFLISGSDDGHVFVVDGRPSKKFEPIGYVDVAGEIQAIAAFMDSNGLTKVAVTSNTSGKASEAADKLTHFSLTANFTENLISKRASLKCDLRSDAIHLAQCNLPSSSSGIVWTEGNTVFTLDSKSKCLVKMGLLEGEDKTLVVQEQFPNHQLCGGQLSLSAHQLWLASSAPDGKVIVRLASEPSPNVTVSAHDFRLGGAVHTVFSPDGTKLLTSGKDGVLVCFKWNFSSAGQQKAKDCVEYHRTMRTSLLGYQKPEDGAMEEMAEWAHPTGGTSRPGSGVEKAEKEQLEKEQAIEKAMEEDAIYSTPTPTPSADSTWLEQREIEAVKEEDKGYSTVKADLRSQIRDMRRQLQSMMKDNEEVDEIERLNPHEFDLDVEEQARLQAEGDAEVQRIREEKEFDNLAKAYLTDLIKRECWDDMIVKGRGITAFNNALECHNYPMKARTKEEQDKLDAAKIRRQIEIEELAARKEYADITQKSTSTPHNTKGKGGKRKNKHKPKDDELLDGEDEVGAKEQPSTTGSLGAQYGGDSELFYSQFELNMREQKMNQIVLLEDAIYRIRMNFNKEFEGVFEKKEQEISKIRERNKRIYKILIDLDLPIDLTDPELGITEKPEMLLTVKDEEVTVEKYLTPEQAKLAEEAKKLEDERRMRERGDNWRERGLNMMMGGVLEIKKEDELKKDIPMPAFMTAKPESEWSEDEKKAAQDYERRVKELEEERDKYRKQLEQELRKLQTQIQDGTLMFDETLQKLFNRKIKTEMVIYQEELKILRLKYSLLQEEELNHREEELNHMFEFKQQMKGLNNVAVMEARKHMDAFREQYDILVAEDKVMDKAFKREFHDVPAHFVDILHKLFRRRPRGQKARASTETPIYDPSSSNPFSERPSTARQSEQAASAMETALAELDKDSNMPEGLDLPVWERMCAYRRQKIESEQLVKQKALVLADMQAFYQKRQEEAEQIKMELEDLINAISRLKEDRMRFLCNLEVQLLMKQGQVEIDSGPFIPEYNDSILIHRSTVEELNGKIRQFGETKIASMMESKDFRKSIVQLEWEHRKMMMETEDLHNKMRDIQNLKVTREIQAFLNEEDYDSKKSQEIATLDQTLLVQKQCHEKNVREKKRQLKELKKIIKDKTEENGSLGTELEELNVSVNERRHIHEVNADKRSDAGREKRYREIVQRRQFVELAKAQAQEVAVLRAEVERLRMRTFPALVQVEH